MTWLKKYLPPLLCFIFFMLSSCISFEKGIQSKLYFSSSNIAVYKLEENFLSHANVPSVNKVPIDEKLIQKIFFSIRKEKSILQVSGKETLWELETVDELAPVIKDILSEANRDKTFFLVVKEEDNLSPYSRLFRTTLYMNREANVLQLIFGEVNNNINFGMQFSFQDWANPNFFKLGCEKKKVVQFDGRLAPSFQYKKDSTCAANLDLSKETLESRLEILTNYKWVLVDLEKANILSKEKDSENQTGKSRKSREIRLKELQDLYKKGLITKDDYEMKKAEILGEL